ncbi:endonuclease/exonuclease/phosphatase family protein [Patescibacteria group bacterium]|nr:endonuclease/exonuclease/phosphatase family protein [Patescibacteria group bacterium]
MELISLNVWGARAGLEELLAFFQERQDVDVFCLQEVWDGGEHMLNEFAAGRSMGSVETQLLTKIKNVLPDHVAYFRPSFFDFWGLTMLVKKTIPIVAEGEHFIYRERGYFSKEDIADHARNLQYIVAETAEGLRTIINLHAAWQPGGKGDTEARLLQSQAIIDCVEELGHPAIIMGDFNLLPDSKSIALIESVGFHNLIREHGVTSTRTTLYTKPVRFADYTFVGPEIKVKEFKILPEEVSDHNAMYLET